MNKWSMAASAVEEEQVNYKFDDQSKDILKPCNGAKNLARIVSYMELAPNGTQTLEPIHLIIIHLTPNGWHFFKSHAFVFLTTERQVNLCFEFNIIIQFACERVLKQCDMSTEVKILVDSREGLRTICPGRAPLSFGNVRGGWLLWTFVIEEVRCGRNRPGIGHWYTIWFQLPRIIPAINRTTDRDTTGGSPHTAAGNFRSIITTYSWSAQTV